MSKTKKSLGIVGGMGSHASAWLLQRITDLSVAQKDQDYLEIILHNNSNIPDRTRAIVLNEESPIVELTRSINFFNVCQIDVALLACMTAHFYHKELSKIFRGCLLDASEIVSSELTGNGRFQSMKKIGLIGSTGLLRSRIFQNKLEPLGFEMVLLNDDEQEEFFMEPLYRKSGIKTGLMNGEIKALISKGIYSLLDSGAEVIVGACSEAPLITDKKIPVPFIDVFDLLAVKTVQYCYNN